MGKATLGTVLRRIGRDREAEEQLAQAAQTIEAIAAGLTTERFRVAFRRRAGARGLPFARSAPARRGRLTTTEIFG
jgi:hypothetical protein